MYCTVQLELQIRILTCRLFLILVCKKKTNLLHSALPCPQEELLFWLNTVFSDFLKSFVFLLSDQDRWFLSVLLSGSSLVTPLGLHFPQCNTQLVLCSEIQVLEATSGPRLLPWAELRCSLESLLLPIGWPSTFFYKVLPAAWTDADSSKLC